MKFTITLVGNSPLLMHNPRMVDPEFEINVQMKALTSKRSKTEADQQKIQKLEWFGGLYDVDGVVVQPTSKVRKCLINTARITKKGKEAERAILFPDMHVPLVHNGPKKIEEIFEDKRFHSRLSVGVNRKRVMRTRPSFFPWSLTAEGLFVEDAGMKLSDLEAIVELAGIVEGIGDNRVNGYGRFTATLSTK